MKDELVEATKNMDMEQVVHYLVDGGYIKEDLTPIKCTMCDSSNLTNTNYEIGGYNIPDGVVCEYQCICQDCGQVNGTWSFGGWIL